jgi:dihydroxy-acid dehydratase
MTTPTRPILRSQRLRLTNHQGDALRLGMNWTEEDLGKPQVLVDSARLRDGPPWHVPLP